MIIHESSPSTCFLLGHLQTLFFMSIVANLSPPSNLCLCFHPDLHVTHLYPISNLYQIICPKLFAKFSGFGVTGKFRVWEDDDHLSSCSSGKSQPLAKMHHRHPTFSLPWKSRAIFVLALSSPTHHTYSAPEPLSPPRNPEENDLISAEQRLFHLYQAYEVVSLPLLVDAEYIVVQRAIDSIYQQNWPLVRLKNWEL
jgi:hypothetical protein